ncbi:hypothetical protein NDI54_16055 [Haloarcula sp. S1AR25-5A]|uniref:Uncharacterized protein n=1 Tax=Haloarcula terrestris TaxID=2950533 RepID=A0AAE4JIR8_9EURY|nr:hypothetical protein [Haloarcula terrestris]MDS0222860.1 hypothetical protein [Haloarcula terrestris]
MTVFNFDLGSDIHIDTEGEGINLRFNGDTLGFEPTADGMSVTNDWNNRHFTLAFDEDSIFYHITREDSESDGSGNEGVLPEHFITEIYGYVRSIDPPVPADQLDFEVVGRADLDEMQAYLDDKAVVQETDNGIRIDHENRVGLGEFLNNNPAELGKLYERILHPVPFEEAIDPKSGENIFLYPTSDIIYVLFTFPDCYVSVVPAQRALSLADEAGGSQVIDHVLRSMSPE